MQPPFIGDESCMCVENKDERGKYVYLQKGNYHNKTALKFLWQKARMIFQILVVTEEGEVAIAR
jgi:hypothetical protein